MEGTVLGDKEQGVGIRDKNEVELDTEDQVLFPIWFIALTEGSNRCQYESGYSY